MNPLDGLIACAGNWRGTSTLQDPNNMAPDESPSTAVVTPVLGGRFVRLDYTWAYKGKPQEGSLLIGFDPKEETVTGHWIDGWHNGHKVMAMSEKPEGAVLSVRGSYAAPPGPDWGWRINVTPDKEALRMVMFNIWPEGQEDLAVEASYTRG